MIPMKDSTIDPTWLQQQMQLNPPSKRPNGIIFSGPVRLAFANLFKPGKPPKNGGEAKYSAALLFPPGTDMKLFADEWIRVTREKFPKQWDPNGNPVGLEQCFHDQATKAYGAPPYAGYTPGAIFFNASSKFKPSVVDANQNLIADESRAYSGVWAFVGLNIYPYDNMTKGASFGLQTVMIIGDDTKLSGGGGDPSKDFAGVKITAQSNIAAKFDTAPQAQQQSAAASILPNTGHVGMPGNLPVHAVGEPSLDDLA